MMLLRMIMMIILMMIMMTNLYDHDDDPDDDHDHKDDSCTAAVLSFVLPFLVRCSLFLVLLAPFRGYSLNRYGRSMKRWIRCSS